MTPDPIYVWTSPAGTELPIRTAPFRFAVGTPHGPSSNSWRVWINKDDVYVACRDNFNEFKVSLHASGIWRVALTEQALRKRRDFATTSGDRVLHRHKPDLANLNRPLIAFQIVVLAEGIYLAKERRRKKWPSSIVFVEPPEAPGEMTILSVCVVPSIDPLRGPPGVRGAVVAVVPFQEQRTIQVVATHENDAGIRQLLRDTYQRAGHTKESPGLPPDAVFVVWGHRPNDIPWFSAVLTRDVADGRI